MADVAKVKQFVEETWEASIVSALHTYIAIPNQSPRE
jgi:hypothetical protein